MVVYLSNKTTTKTHAMKTQKNLRPATIEDFKVGTVLYVKEGWSFSLTNKYGEGMWECREGKIIYEGEINLYKVA
jgi:hypothetical protein